MPAPGVYINATTATPESLDIRTDQAALIGYAEKGPAFVATPVNSFAHFVEIFGESRIAYLTQSAKSFFDNGGIQLYVIRVVAGSAQTASTNFPSENSGFLPLFKCVACAPFYVGPGKETEKKARRKFDQAKVSGTQRYYRIDSPGHWGNDLEVLFSLQHPTKYSILQWEPQLNRMRLSSVTRLEPGSIINVDELYDDGVTPEPRWLRVVSVDTARQTVTVSTMPAHLAAKDCSGASIYSTELTIRLLLRKQQVEVFEHLGFHETHSRYFVDVLNEQSLFVAMSELGLVGDDWRFLESLSGSYPLSGGQLNMADLLVKDFKRGIENVLLEQNIALVSAPDLVYQQRLSDQQIPRFIDNNICQFLLPSAKGRLQGKVINEANMASVAHARVILRASLESYDNEVLMYETTTDNTGTFYLDGLPAGNATLNIESSAYDFEEFPVTIESFGRLTEETFTLTPIDLPPLFDEEDILTLQKLMVLQAENARSHFVFLDTPAIANKLDEVMNWRFHFDSKYASLIYPWVKLSHQEFERELPTSALVMGAIAQTDLKKGVHYSSANLPLISHGQLKHGLTESEHEQLNEANVNSLLIKPGDHLYLLGARTLSFERSWRYITSSRLLMFLIRFLEQRMQWVTFEPNSHLLRIAIQTKLTSLMMHLWRKGALSGKTPGQAFSVLCDETNNTEASRDGGQIVAEIGVAPTEPGEFIWLVYQRNADRATVEIQ